MASKMNSVASILNRPRPIINLVDRHDEELTCAAKPVDMVYVRNCTGCTVHVRGSAAKCILGGSAACTSVMRVAMCDACCYICVVHVAMCAACCYVLHVATCAACCYVCCVLLRVMHVAMCAVCYYV